MVLTMFFNTKTPLEDIQKWVDTQLKAMYPISQNGIEIAIIQHKSKRSVSQNNFLMCIMTHIVKLYITTGFMPAGCQPWMMRTDVQKAYWKARFGVEQTSKMSTAEFTKFIDFIQNTMVEETQGNYEILTTDSAYLKSLLEY